MPFTAQVDTRGVGYDLEKGVPTVSIGAAAAGVANDVIGSDRPEMGGSETGFFEQFTGGGQQRRLIPVDVAGRYGQAKGILESIKEQEPAMGVADKNGGGLVPILAVGTKPPADGRVKDERAVVSLAAGGAVIVLASMPDNRLCGLGATVPAILVVVVVGREAGGQFHGCRRLWSNMRQGCGWLKTFTFESLSGAVGLLTVKGQRYTTTVTS